ncbi:MAG: FAD-dependent oxidoreductase [Pseudomonadota bacterium]
MRTGADVIVVGAGVSGLFTALKLSDIGLHPEVIPAPDVSDLLASPDAALAPPWRRPTVFNQLEARSVKLLPELTTRLSQETGVDLALERQAMVALDASMEIPPTWLDQRREDIRTGVLSDFEPQLAQGHREALSYGRREALRGDRLKKALSLALARRGITVQQRSPVRRLEVAGNIVLGVELEDGRLQRADLIVLAAEQASSNLLHASGLESVDAGGALAPALQLAPSSAAVRSAVLSPTLMLSPRLDGRLLAISNLDEQGRATLTMDQLRQLVHASLPGLGRHDLERSGLLEVPDGQSRVAIGAYPGVRGFWMNVGHEAQGPLLALAAAEFLAEQLNGGAAVRELAVTLSRSSQLS